MIYAIHPVGKLTVTPEGAYLHFHAEAPQAAGLLRLWLSGCGRCESLGLMEPRGGRLVFDCRLSRRELCCFPAQIERAELAAAAAVGRARAGAEPAPSHDASDVIWRGDAGTELVAEINGRRYIALPAKLRRPSHCSRNIGGQEYVIFPAPSCKNGDNSV
ncbi:MAG: hypothetical protein V8S72_00185 [Oscillospiraceae bacterium]